MDFEDIVDMDWIDSNTTSDDSLPTSSSGSVAIKQEPMEHHSPFQSTAFDADSLYRFTEQPFLWQQDLTTSASASASCSSPVSPSSPCSLPDKDDDHPMSKQDVKLPPELMMPSTEHIKQLIEIAKRHLVLREQGLRPEDIHASAAAAAAAATMPLFTTTPTVMPDTVAPESLMKLSAAAAAAATINTENQPSSPMEKKTSDVKKPSNTTPPPTSTRRASSVSLGEETMTKNYRMMLGGIKRGMLYGGRTGALCLMYGSVESTLDRIRGEDDILNSVAAGITSGVVFSAMTKLTRGSVRYAVKAGLLFGLVAGGLSDLHRTLAGNPPPYVKSIQSQVSS